MSKAGTADKRINDQTPEGKAKVSLSGWLERSGATVFWEQETAYDYSTFAVSKTGGYKPDMIVMSENGMTVALEVKDGWDSANVYDAPIQLFNYWRDYVEGNAEYSVDSRIAPIDIDAFAIATQYSIQGAVFCPDGERDVMREDYASGRQTAARYGHLPDTEYNRSEAVRCFLTRLVRDEYGGGSASDEWPGLGLLLSDDLDSESGEIIEPYVLYYQNGDCWEPVV